MLGWVVILLLALMAFVLILLVPAILSAKQAQARFLTVRQECWDLKARLRVAEGEAAKYQARLSEVKRFMEKI